MKLSRDTKNTELPFSTPKSLHLQAPQAHPAMTEAASCTKEHALKKPQSDPLH